MRVETRDAIAVFTNRGARLKSWRLKHYQDEKHEPVELVSHEFGDKQPLPFSLRVPSETLTKTLNGALYSVAGVPDSSAPVTAPTQLTFEYRDSDGLRAVKEFHLEPANYLIAFGASVTDHDRSVAPVIEWGPALGDVDLTTGRGAVKARGLFSIANDVAKYFAIIPAMFAGTFPVLNALNIMRLQTPGSAILSAVIFNAVIIIALIPLALRGVRYRPLGAAAVLRRNLWIYGVGGVIIPFPGIKLVDLLLVALGLA